MSSKPNSGVTPKMRAQKSIAAVAPSAVPSIKSTTVNNNTPFDKAKMLEMRKQRNQSIAAAGGMANLSFFSGKMIEAFKQTGRTPVKNTSQEQVKKRTCNNPEAFRSFVGDKMMEAVNISKQSSGGGEGGGRPRGRPKKVIAVELVKSPVSDPNDYVTPVFSLDSSSILDMVLSENRTESPSNNSDETDDKKMKTNEPEPDPEPQTSSIKIEVEADAEVPSIPRPSSSSNNKKPFQLRQQLRLNPKKKKIEPPKIKTPRLVGEVSDIRQQLLSKFSQVTSIKPKAVDVISSKPFGKSVPSTSKNIQSSKTNSGNRSSCPPSLSLKKITPVAIKSTPRCSLSKKPSKQNISLADPSRKMAGAVQFMLSSAITKVLQSPTSNKRRKISSTPSQPSGRGSSSTIPVGFGRPTRPPGPGAHQRSKKGLRPNEGSSSDEDLVDSLVKPWELENEEDDDEQFEEGPYEVDDVKIEVVNDEDEDDEEEMTSYDPLDMPYNLEEDNVKIEVTNDEYNTPLFEGFQYDEEAEETHCDYDDDQPVMDIKPDVNSQTIIEIEPIELSSQIVKTEPQENATSEYII